MINLNLQSTTVKGDPEKINALKDMGHGMISYAFRIGCDIVLGISTDDIEILTKNKIDLQKEHDVLEGKINQIASKIKSIEAQRTQSKFSITEDDINYNKLVSEYKRCSSLIMFKGMTQLASYLAEMTTKRSAAQVRGFFDECHIEPTEHEIKCFIDGD